ncbi:MAG: ABC transporter substrate-binding protein [Niameybacter sp.]|uniref:ABC transporter substrate-binding protein n=1 Tax=Niameybacter sp. TaxID=2033640 RepID=UPI002FC65228
MKRRKFLQALIIASCMSIVGCSSPQPTPEKVLISEEAAPESSEVAKDVAYPVSIVDSTGTTITLNEEPQKIVSLAPSTTEILGALGISDKVVGRTKYCNYPETIQDATDVGGTSNPNVETIVALQPDLVVASTHVSDEVIAKLREINIPVAFLNEQENFEGTYSAIENIGLLVGCTEEAKIVVEGMRTQIEETIKKVNALNKEEKPRVYYAVWYGDSDSTAGGDTFIGEMIRLAGGENIAQDVEGWSISKEKIVEGNPEMIIVPAGNGIKEGMETTDFYKDLTAVQEGHIYEINQDMISRQGPRLAEAFVALAKIINPEME